MTPQPLESCQCEPEYHNVPPLRSGQDLVLSRDPAPDNEPKEVAELTMQDFSPAPLLPLYE
jgi:hypothetical protein